MPMKDFEIHQYNECPVHCPNKEYGCTHTMPRKDWDTAHNHRCKREICEECGETYLDGKPHTQKYHRIKIFEHVKHQIHILQERLTCFYDHKIKYLEEQLNGVFKQQLDGVIFCYSAMRAEHASTRVDLRTMRDHISANQTAIQKLQMAIQERDKAIQELQRTVGKQDSKIQQLANELDASRKQAAMQNDFNAAQFRKLEQMILSNNGAAAAAPAVDHTEPVSTKDIRFGRVKIGTIVKPFAHDVPGRISKIIKVAGTERDAKPIFTITVESNGKKYEYSSSNVFEMVLMERI
jgi:hypothetical protein